MHVPAGDPEAAAPHAEDAVVAALMSVGRLMKVRTAAGVDPGTHHLLQSLACADSPRVTDLAAAARLDTSTVSRHVQGLERLGLVVRSQHREDRRAQSVDLTRAGRETLERSMRARKRLIADLVAEWPREDVETLARLLTRLADELTASAADVDADVSSGRACTHSLASAPPSAPNQV